MEAVPSFARDDAGAVRGGILSAGPDDVSERELVRRAQAGELAAFERLYRSTVRLVHALCLRMTCDAGRAEELTQDVFVRAWRKLPTFRGESAFATWLTRLTVNVVLTERRERGRRERRIELSDDLEALSPAASGPHPGTVLDLESAIARLPEQARRVFVLHDVEGWGHAEIASFTGVAVGTSKSHLHRARALLREALNR